MDSKLPEIKPEVQKDDEKKGGFFANLFSRSGGGAAGELGAGLGSGGGLGGLGGLGSAGLSGGLLATKAGLIGLIMIGTTVAGGLGVIGYKAFGPGSEDRLGGPLQLFSPRPPEPQKTADALQDGNSQSLSFLASANQTPPEPVAAPANTEDALIDKNAAAAAAPAAIGDGQGNKANVGANKAGKLQSDKKFGELSKLGATGGSASSSASLSNPNAALGARAASNGASSASGRSASGNLRGLAGRRLSSGNSLRQAYVARSQGRGASNMRAAGTQFDGGGSGVMGPDGGLAAGGAGTGAGTPTTANPTTGRDAAERFPPPLGVKGKNVTPWQNAITTAMMCIAGAAACLMLASKMAKKALADPSGSMKMVVYALCAIATVLSLVAITMGSMMSGGQYGQKFQGMMYMASGGMMLAAAAATAIGFSKESPAMASGNPTGWMLLSGGTALALMMAGSIKKPTKIDSSFFKDGKPPDMGNSSVRESIWKAPSDDALKTFIA